MNLQRKKKKRGSDRIPQEDVVGLENKGYQFDILMRTKIHKTEKCESNWVKPQQEAYIKVRHLTLLRS